MAFNGAGTFVRLYTWVTDRLNSVPITDTRMDGEMDGFATGLSNCITKDGQTATTAKIPFASGASHGDGTVGAPAVAFTNDLDCGMYRIGVNNYGFAAGGAKVLDISTTGLSIVGAVNPTASDGGALGSATLMWSDLFLASGGVINWNNGDVLATHSANALAFTGASSGYSFDAPILPVTDDGAPLGSTTKQFSDIFLASGAVINFNNSNATITHSAGTLSYAATMDFTQQVRWSGVISPAQIAANQTDYNPANLATSTVLRLTSDTTRTIFSISGGASGRFLLAINDNAALAGYIALASDDGSTGTAAQRLQGAEGYWGSVPPQGMAFLFYDATDSRWRIFQSGVPVASQAEMELGTALQLFVAPGVAQHHASACKCWGQTTGAGTPSLTTSYNVTSITDTALGRLTVTIGNDFSSANYAALVNTINGTAALKMTGGVTKAAGSIILESGTAAATLADPANGWDWAFYGDL